MAAISDEIQNMQCQIEFFPYPCGGGILTVKFNCDMIDILRTDC